MCACRLNPLLPMKSPELLLSRVHEHLVQAPTISLPPASSLLSPLTSTSGREAGKLVGGTRSYVRCRHQLMPSIVAETGDQLTIRPTLAVRTQSLPNAVLVVTASLRRSRSAKVIPLHQGFCTCRSVKTKHRVTRSRNGMIPSGLPRSNHHLDPRGAGSTSYGGTEGIGPGGAGGGTSKHLLEIEVVGLKRRVWAAQSKQECRRWVSKPTPSRRSVPVTIVVLGGADRSLQSELAPLSLLCCGEFVQLWFAASSMLC